MSTLTAQGLGGPTELESELASWEAAAADDAIARGDAVEARCRRTDAAGIGLGHRWMIDRPSPSAGRRLSLARAGTAPITRDLLLAQHLPGFSTCGME